MNATCTACSKAISGGDVLYATDGSLVCPQCSMKAEIVGDEQRAAGNIKAAALTSMIAGICCFVFNPLFAATVIAVTSGLYALNGVRPGNERFTRHLTTTDRFLISSGAGIGLLLAALHVVLVFTVLSTVASHR